MEKKNYFTPCVEVVSVSVEKGFAGSLGTENNYASEGESGLLQEGDIYDL